MRSNLVHTPEGVRDIYGKELQSKLIIKSKVHEQLKFYGYRDIQTPSFEFFDIFGSDVGTTPSKELYKFFDKEGNTLALRPDFTPSVARCAAKYFMEDSIPIRLCYEGSAFNNTSELQGKLKETTQMGAELIGDPSEYADAEMICMVIDALKSCGFDKFTVSIGEMDYFKGICEEACLRPEVVADLREAISVKNFFGAQEILDSQNLPKRYYDVILQVGDITSISDLAKVKEMIDNRKSQDALKRLEAIYRIVDSYGFGDYISIDLGMLSKYHYYTGVIFKAFTYGTGDAIVKGGRYDTLLKRFGKDAPAVGCVFLIDDIMSALKAQDIMPYYERKEIAIVFDKDHREEAFAKMKSLRSKGHIVSGTLKEQDIDKEEYEAFGAAHQVSETIFLLNE